MQTKYLCLFPLIFSFVCGQTKATTLPASPTVIKKVQTTYHNKYAVKRVQAYFHLLKQLQGKSKKAQLNAVNNFFNMIDSAQDRGVWGKAEFFANPIEMLALNASDCEDYAIAKYVALKTLGFKESSLRIYVGREYNSARRIGHTVLAYYPSPDSTPLILGNINRYIRPSTSRRDFTRYYGFNMDKVDIYEKKIPSRSIKRYVNRFKASMLRMQTQNYALPRKAYMDYMNYYN